MVRRSDKLFGRTGVMVRWSDQFFGRTPNGRITFLILRVLPTPIEQ